jgi:flagellar hook-associated protein 3 FlgL
MAIIGIPSTRVSDMFVRERLIEQMQLDQRELLRLQTQLTTGRQFERPGEEPIAALRVMSMQRLLEQKAQVRDNVTTTRSFLDATDVAMSDVASLVAEARALAVTMSSDATVDETQREAAVQQLDETIGRLMDIGNQVFRDRYLFAGSATDTTPFQLKWSSSVEYFGNEEQLPSYCDVDLLLPSNVSGSVVFGAISEPVRGSVDLDPALTANTRLADLHGGEGITLGSIVISDGLNASTVDLSTAETIGDVAALIAANPPQGRTLDVQITATGLTMQLDAAPGDLSIREVLDGTTAYELGILEESGVGNNPLVGENLDPALRKTTRLAELLGGGLDQTGLEILNGGNTYAISFAAAETVEDVLNLLNGSEAGVLAEINATGTGIDVRSRLSGEDFAIGENGGTTATQLGLRTLTRETKLEDLNYGRGLNTHDGVDFTIELTDGTVLDIDLTTEETIGDVLDLINAVAGGSLGAGLVSYGNGIELVDTNGGAQPLTVTRTTGSFAANELGLIPQGEDSVSVSGGPPVVLSGDDPNPQETAGLFTGLLRLRRAVEENDLAGIERAVQILDVHVLESNLARAELGARMQGLEALDDALETENIQLREAMSQDYDADFAQVTSELMARQIALQAALMTTAESFRLTLLNYL